MNRARDNRHERNVHRTLRLYMRVSVCVFISFCLNKHCETSVVGTSPDDC